MTTVADLEAQKTALDQQIAAIALPLVNSARDRLADPAVATLVSDLQAIQVQLPLGNARTQIGNILIVLSQVPGILQNEASQYQALVDAAAASAQPA